MAFTDYTTLDDAIQGFISLTTGLDGASVRPAYQNAPSLPSQDRGLLCSFNIINQTEIGIDGHSYANQGEEFILDETISGDRNITVSIKAYGSNAQFITERIVLGLKTSVGSSYLLTNDIGYLRHGSVLNLSSIQNGSYENRRQVDIEFHIKTSVTADVNAIESAEIGYTFYGSKEKTGTIEVTDES